jgi:hypothetical protein
MLIFDVELISVKAPAPPASALPPGGAPQAPSSPPAPQPK